ncbi:MAG: G/U mismatch-specific DNA glycosylase [Actinomycetota bacterium]
MTAPNERPSKEDLAAAYGKEIDDVIARGLDVLFVGINPGLYSGATGHHFARPGNRFWPALHLAGFTERQLRPSEKSELLSRGLGVTNLVARSTATASELQAEELVRGARRLRAKIGRYRPRWAAFLGISTYRVAFATKTAVVGRQERTIGATGVWVLPNPSGLNAHYQLPDLVKVFTDLRGAVERSR